MHDIKLLTIKEISDHYRVSVRTVRRWIAIGKLKAIGQGRLTRVRPADRLAFEEAFLRERTPLARPYETQHIRHSHTRVGRRRAKRSG